MYTSIRITKPNINTFYLLHNIIKYYKRKPVIHFTMPFFKSLSLLEKKKKNDRKILHRDDKELQRQEWEILVRIEWKLNCVTLLFSSLPLFLPFDFPPSLPHLFFLFLIMRMDAFHSQRNDAHRLSFCDHQAGWWPRKPDRLTVASFNADLYHCERSRGEQSASVTAVLRIDCTPRDDHR